MLHLFTCHGCIMPRLAELLLYYFSEKIRLDISWDLTDLSYFLWKTIIIKKLE